MIKSEILSTRAQDYNQEPPFIFYGNTAGYCEVKIDDLWVP